MSRLVLTTWLVMVGITEVDWAHVPGVALGAVALAAAGLRLLGA